MISRSSVATLYATWSFVRSFLHRGWWLVTSLYLVTEAGLTPFELVFLGTAQGLTVIAAEVPAGVFADAYSRKWSLVLAHVLMGLSMVSTGLVLSFPALVVTQMVWGLSWTFSSGADVAWMTDELNNPDATTDALINAAKWGHAGSALGIVTLGALAWATSLSTAMICAGLGMGVLGLLVAIAFSETNFERAQAGKLLSTAMQALRQGVLRLRTHRILIHILMCTYLVNGADEAFGRLHVKQLTNIGLPPDAAPIVWISLLAVVSLSLSFVALALTNRFLATGARDPRAYRTAALIGAIGLAALAASTAFPSAALAVLAVGGVAMTVMRTVSIVWANKSATNEVRATVHSFLSLSENLGEISLGFGLALVASYAGIPAAMIGSCVILAGVAMLVEFRSRGNEAEGTR